MPSSNKYISFFNRSLLGSVGVFLIFVLTFVFYVRSEKAIDKANEQRFSSHQIADELRQSSDDLTRMVRTYILTGDPIYKQHFQEILDIRNGLKPRPLRYEDIYWDLVLSDDKRPRPNIQPVSLLEMMRRVEFTRQEFSLLSEAKNNSDELTRIEFIAMKVFESTTPYTHANQHLAFAMLHDDLYHQAKYAIMKPISDAHVLMDQRTLEAVQQAEKIATMMRILFVAVGLLLGWMLWRIRYALHLILGGSLKLLHSHIAQIGSGDFTAKIQVNKGMEDSILGLLSQTQQKLNLLDAERRKSENALIESEQRLNTIIQTEPECVKIVDSRLRLQEMNPAGLTMLEADTLEEAQNHTLISFLLPPYRTAFIDLHKRIMNGENGTLEFQIVGLHGTRRWLQTHATPMRNSKGEITSLLGITRDVTERKKSESQLVKLSQAIEQSSNAIVITDAQAKIEYVNTAFETITGYTQSEVMGLNPRILKSGKTPRTVYQEMWTSLKHGKAWYGELTNRRKDGTEYIHSTNIAPVIDSNGTTTHYIAIEEDITERKKSEERIRYLANYDPLTGLPNRIKMDDHLHYTLSLAKRNEGIFAVLFLDLDHFKYINDTLGHTIGDLLLIELAKRLTAVVRDEDTVSRMGGDEFVLLLPETDANGAAQVAHKILDSIACPFLLEDHSLAITGSIGIALYPADGSDIETLSKNADAAMYRTKQEGRNDYSFFTQEMQKNSQRNLELSNALHTALQHNEFHLVYQPQLSIVKGNLIGAEALLRWEHPQLGVISPAEFIPIAEDNGMILSIGEWVLRTAVKQAAKWNQNRLNPFIMAINLSAVQFRHPDLPSLITDILKESDLRPDCLEIELTEGVAMYDPKVAVSIMNTLHDIGIRMSIDDFGTGYSSLAYLKQFKIYKIKIDQSFIRDISTDPEDKAIVTAVIQMAHSLGLTTIAEGVETIEQLEYLKAQQCDEVQGYYYSKPLLSEHFEAYIKSHQEEE